MTVLTMELDAYQAANQRLIMLKFSALEVHEQVPPNVSFAGTTKLTMMRFVMTGTQMTTLDAKMIVQESLLAGNVLSKQ